MSLTDLNMLFQQMGEVLSGIRGLHDTVDIRQAQAEQLHELLRSDLATLRRDQRDLEEKLDCLILVTQRDIEQIRRNSIEITRTLEVVISAVDNIRLPVIQVLAFKSRFAGAIFTLGILGSCALWLADPVYKWLVGFLLQGK